MLNYSIVSRKVAYNIQMYNIQMYNIQSALSVISIVSSCLQIRRSQSCHSHPETTLLLFSCWVISFGPIGREKQSFTSFLLVVINYSSRKQKYSWWNSSFVVFLFFKSVPRYFSWKFLNWYPSPSIPQVIHELKSFTIPLIRPHPWNQATA